MSGPVVLVTSRSFSGGSVDLVARLTDAGARVVRGDPSHDLRALQPDLERAVAWIAGTSPVTAEHLAAAPNLCLVARYGVGVDAVDLAAATAAGVVVTNTPGANSDAVAEHALALLLAALRRVVAGDRGVRAQDWSVYRARELRGLVVGIAGFGRIGRALTARLLPFGTTVLTYDPMVSDADIRAAGAEPAALTELPRRCHVVSLHAPAGDVIVDDQWLEGANPELILINTARAALVDESAVARALQNGRLATYAADDIGTAGGDGFSPLLTAELADCVIVTPHSAAQTIEAVDSMGAAATDAVLAVLNGRPPANIVGGRRAGTTSA
jgi:D-3-phosphoglycerate dehydrogenase / 2-oxoglutarate reductase